MPRGPKPQPTNLKLLKGENRTERLNKNEPKPRPVIPKRPFFLSRRAKRIWDLLAPKLQRAGVLTEIDALALAALCQCYARYEEAEKSFDAETAVMEVGEQGYRQQVPEISIAHKYLDRAMKIMTEFGMTPSSRARISIELDDGDDELLD